MSTSTKVAKHFLKHDNIKYFRSNASSIQLGSFGRKKDPVGAMAYLSVHNQVDAQHMVGRARYMGRSTIDWDDTSSAEWTSEGKVTYFTVNGSGTAQADLSRGRQAHLELVKLGIDTGDLQAMLNQSAGGARSYLSREGRDARIVSTIYVVVEAEIAETFSSVVGSGGQVAATLTKALSLEFGAEHSGSTGGKVRVVASPGTTFAYGLHKVTDWNDGKIRSMEDDRKGMG